MRVFLDANILFSGAHPKSRMSAFLRILVREATCLTNAHALEEARRNLALKSSTGILPAVQGERSGPEAKHGRNMIGRNMKTKNLGQLRHFPASNFPAETRAKP